MLGFIDAALGVALIYADVAEALEISTLLGLPLAVVASIALFIAYRRMQSLEARPSNET